ncbi:hypothetical protein EDD16DRAFT_773204 [Pisolithus croceorrhizus]|nr:hypothetical protein EDD16DRAFT_773204 [Pisolithus croceorrhizus]
MHLPSRRVRACVPSPSRIDKAHQILPTASPTTERSTNTPSFSSAAQITQDAIDQAWWNVDELVASKAQFVAYCATLEFEDAESDITRFLVSAIVRRHVSEDPSSKTGVSDPSWGHFLRLLNNELANVRERRHICSSPNICRRLQGASKVPSTAHTDDRARDARERHWERFRGLGRGSQG